MTVWHLDRASGIIGLGTSSPSSCVWGAPTILAGLAGDIAGPYLLGLSDDGTIALGSHQPADGNQYAVTWTNLGAPVELPLLTVTDNNDYACAINAGKSKIFGFTADPTTLGHAVVWEGGTVTDLGALASDKKAVSVSACNADGTIVVGQSTFGATRHATVWTYAAGVWSVTDLGVLPGGQGSNAYGISRDGTTIVGQADDPSDSNTRACYWQLAGGVWTIHLLPFTGLAGPNRRDTALGAYGSIIVGYLDSSFVSGGSSPAAAEWNSGGVPVTLPGFPTSQGLCIASNGSLIGGVNADVDGYGHGAVWISGSPNTLTQLPDPAGYDGSYNPSVDALSSDGEVAGGNTNDGSNTAPLIWQCH